jgi:hypothetical protein
MAGGVFAYSLTTSPEAKLAKAFENLLEEEVIQMNSDFSVASDFDFTAEDMDIPGEEAEYFDIFKDVMENITGTSSVIIDRENKVIEAGINYGVSGDIQGSPISLQIPFRFYIDEEAEEIAFDLDPYVDFSEDFIETTAHHIIPHIPEAEETLALLNDGTYSAEWAVEEFTDVITPLIEDILSEKQVTDSYDLDTCLFSSEHSEDYKELTKFIIIKMFEDLNSDEADNFITEEDNWIYLSTDVHDLLDAFAYAMKEIEHDDDMLEKFYNIGEEQSNKKIKDIKKEFQDQVEELEEEFDRGKKELTGDVNLGFYIKDNKITSITSDMELELNNSESQHSKSEMSISTVMAISIEFMYSEDAEFSFYGQDREEFDVEEAGSLIEKHTAWYMIENYEVFEGIMTPEETPASPDENDDTSYQDYELTDDDLALFAAIEAGEITAEDDEMDETEFYLEVLALEAEGLVAPGTADQYLP